MILRHKEGSYDIALGFEPMSLLYEPSRMYIGLTVFAEKTVDLGFNVSNISNNTVLGEYCLKQEGQRFLFIIIVIFAFTSLLTIPIHPFYFFEIFLDAVFLVDFFAVFLEAFLAVFFAVFLEAFLAVFECRVGDPTRAGICFEIGIILSIIP